jgi:hypothetical protein
MSGMVEIKRKKHMKMKFTTPSLGWRKLSKTQLWAQKLTLLHKCKSNHSTLAALILTILFSEMLNFYKKIPTTEFCEVLNLHEYSMCQNELIIGQPCGKAAKVVLHGSQENQKE